MKTLLRLAAVVALLLSILYCDSDGSRNAVDDRAEIVTVKWEPDEHGFRQFSTNDLRYEDHILRFCRGDSYQQPMTSVITKVKRVSGIGAGVLSVIFCFRDHENFYDFMIATNGEYGV